MKGAALILQTHSSATQLCSSALGRNLFKWYGLIEDECCLLLGCRPALPKAWRQEDLRIRRFIAASEYSQVSKDQLQSRILDDVLQGIMAIVPNMADVLATIPELKGSIGEKRMKMIDHIQSKLIYILDYLESLRTSRPVMQLFQTIEVGFPYRATDSACCPELPFSPIRFLYPPAGVVFICFLAIRNYIMVMLYAPIQADGVRIERLELESKFDEHNAYEMCRAYAAIEGEFDDDLSCLLSCFRPMTVAGLSCPTGLRRWYWHKLGHLEGLGATYIEPVKRYISVVLGLPEILTLGFDFWKQIPLENRIMSPTAGEIDMAAKTVVTTCDSELPGGTDME